MSLYLFEIPILDYYGGDVFYKRIYIRQDVPPTQDDLVAVLKAQEKIQTDNLDEQYASDRNEYTDCLESLKYVREFPLLKQGLIKTNSFVIDHPSLPLNNGGRYYPLIMWYLDPLIYSGRNE